MRWNTLNSLCRATALVAAALTLFAAPLSAQPLTPSGNDQFGGTPGMNLFLPSQFIRSIHQDRLQMARARYFQSEYDKAYTAGDNSLALAYADSLIHISESRSIRGVHATSSYENRARLLKAMGDTRGACVAFDRAITVQDSLMRLAQSESIREMQSSYELDKLALDKALLKARHHRVALISMSLLLLAVIAGVVFIFFTNRRIQRLQRELLLQMQHSEESERKKLAFINTICHEVRTPLNCITGFSELMCAPEVSAEEYGQYSDILRDNCHQLRYIFDDILEVAFLESLHDPLPRNYIDLCALCRTQLHAMKVKFPKPGVLYQSQIPTEEIGISANPKYLTMLIALLLGNAHKFTQKGFVRIECGRDEADRAFIAVADSGCGIPLEEHEHVFDRFTKLDSFSQGNGLGLYLTRLIVGQMGGTIRIDPTYTGGTRIVAVLPRK